VRVTVLMDRITMHVKEMCVRLGMEGLLYGMQMHALRVEELMLHSGSLKWSFDLEISDQGISLSTVSSRVIVGEMDLPTVKAQSKVTGIINMALGLFARQIKDLIPSIVEQALKDLVHIPIIRWEDMHSLIREAVPKPVRGASSSDAGWGVTLQASASIRTFGGADDGPSEPQKTFACWVDLMEEAPTSWDSWFSFARPAVAWRTLWLEVWDGGDDCDGIKEDCHKHGLFWYDSAGRYALDGSERTAAGSLSLDECEVSVESNKLKIRCPGDKTMQFCAGTNLELLLSAVKAVMRDDDDDLPRPLHKHLGSKQSLASSQSDRSKDTSTGAQRGSNAQHGEPLFPQVLPRKDSGSTKHPIGFLSSSWTESLGIGR